MLVVYGRRYVKGDNLLVVGLYYRALMPVVRRNTAKWSYRGPSKGPSISLKEKKKRELRRRHVRGNKIR